MTTYLRRLRLRAAARAAKSSLQAVLAQLKAVLPSKVSAATPSAGAGAGAGEEEEDGGSTGAGFTHQCRWDGPTRALLHRLDALCSQWVRAENAALDVLSAAERRLYDGDAKALVERDEQGGLLKHVVDACFPASTRGGDVTALRRQLTAEKTRLKKVVAGREERNRTLDEAASKWSVEPHSSSSSSSSSSLAGPGPSSSSGKKKAPPSPRDKAGAGVGVGGGVGDKSEKKKAAPRPKPPAEPIRGHIYPPKKVRTCTSPPPNR